MVEVLSNPKFPFRVEPYINCLRRVILSFLLVVYWIPGLPHAEGHNFGGRIYLSMLRNLWNCNLGHYSCCNSICYFHRFTVYRRDYYYGLLSAQSTHTVNFHAASALDCLAFKSGKPAMMGARASNVSAGMCPGVCGAQPSGRGWMCFSNSHFCQLNRWTKAMAFCQLLFLMNAASFDFCWYSVPCRIFSSLGYREKNLRSVKLSPMKQRGGLSLLKMSSGLLCCLRPLE